MSHIPQHGFKAENLIKSSRTTKSNLDDVKKWLSYRSNIPRMSDEQIALFLIACDNVIEAAQHTIECYFKCKAAAPELFANRDIDSEELQFTLRVTKAAHFPKRTKENYAILMACLRDTYYYNFNHEQQTKLGFTVLELALYPNPPNGIIIIIDMRGVGLMHLTRLKLGVVKKMLAYLQEALPTQLKRVHVLNASYVFDKLLAMFKPFIKKELFDVIIPHPPSMPMEEFFEKHIPASCMPADFGGELPSLDQLSEDFQNDCRKLRTFFEADEKQIQRYINRSRH